MIYTIPYVILILFLGTLAFINASAEDEQKKTVTSVAAVVVFFIFFGFRGYLSTDWTSYVAYYDKCTIDYIIDYTPISGYLEPGFTALTLLCKNVFGTFQSLVVITTAINLVLLLKFFKNRIDNIPLGLILFVVFEGLIMSINLLRNTIAILIFVNALKYITERRPLPYFLLCALAMSFHLTAVLYFPMYFILRIKINKWMYLGIFLVLNAIFILNIPIVLKLITSLGLVGEMTETKIESYTEIYDESTKLSIGYLERLITGGLVFCYFDRLKELRQENTIFINSLILVFSFVLGFNEFHELSRRLGTLFTYSYWILWADMIRCFAIDNNRKLYVAFLSIYCVLRIMGTSNNILMDYDNVLFGAKTYQERLYIYNRNSD